MTEWPALDELRKQLRDYNLRAVARASGLSYSTVLEFVNGKVQPKYATAIALIKFLASRQEPPAHD